MELLSKFRKSKITRSMPMDIIGYTPEEFKLRYFLFSFFPFLSTGMGAR